MASPRVVVSCVGENREEWLARIQNLVLSLRRFGGTLAGAPVVVNLVGGVRPELARPLAGLGADVRAVEPMDRRLPTSNKLRMLELAATDDFDVLLMLDCDVIVHGDLAHDLVTDSVRAAPAGKSHLPPTAWTQLYRDLGIPEPSSPVTLVSGERSHPYFNTGVLVVAREACLPLLEHWQTSMQRFFDLADRSPTLRTFLKDQIPFACAVAAAGIEVDLLPLNLNLSTTRGQVTPAYRDQRGPPFILHYHHSIDAGGFIEASPNDDVNRYLDEFNRCRAEALGLHYPGMTPLSVTARARAKLAAQPWFWQAKHRYLRARKRSNAAFGRVNGAGRRHG